MWCYAENCVMIIIKFIVQVGEPQWHSRLGVWLTPQRPVFDTRQGHFFTSEKFLSSSFGYELDSRECNPVS